MVIVNELKSVKPKRLKDLNNKEFKLRAWVIVPPFVKKTSDRCGCRTEARVIAQPETQAGEGRRPAERLIVECDDGCLCRGGSAGSKSQQAATFKNGWFTVKFPSSLFGPD
jgi:hypothetical protein